MEQGDARRRASVRLVVEGLDAEGGGRRERALSRYERAIRVDPTNGYAYLALARHHVELGDADAALAHLEQAQLLIASERNVGAASPGARDRLEPHLVGLRGAALGARGDARSSDYLSRAARLAPRVWGDGMLGAQELR